MRKTGNRQMLCCGAWMLAAVLLGGLNLFPLISMEALPTMGSTPTIRDLQMKLQRFDAILEANGLPLPARWELPGFFNPSPAAGNAPAERPPRHVQVEPGSQMPEQTPLPALSGIIRTLDADGSVYFQAVLNGRGYREKEKFDDFTVNSITTAGVILRRSEKTWFIRCPTPYYSCDQGE
jgi:hypothetical protein